MSRPLILGVLGILVVLLAVMSSVVRPKTKADLEREMADKAAAAQAKQTASTAPSKSAHDLERESSEKVMREKQNRMREMMNQKKPPTAAAAASQKGGTKRRGTGIEISSSWYKKQKPGAEGLVHLRKEYAEAEKASQAAMKELQERAKKGLVTAKPSAKIDQ